MINLTPQERDKFALWLEQGSETDNGIAEQMEKVNEPEDMIKRIRDLAAAKRLVAIQLRAAEEQTRGGGSPRGRGR